MRLILFALGAFGLYKWLKQRRQRSPSGLLSDMRGEKTPHIAYEVTEHDGGWAYKVGDVYSEAFATRQEAMAAAEQAAAAHRQAGSDEFIQYQDRRGRWHEEVEPGDDRPETEVRGPAPGE